MLKTAYELGMKVAYEQAGLTPDQMSAAQSLGALGGGTLGAGLGGLAGRYLGGRAAEAFDLDEPTAQTVGAGLGALLGGGLGGYAGYQVPKLRRGAETPASAEMPSEAGMGLDDLYMDPYMGLGDYGYYDYGY